jgi:DNA-binding NarL/FixJ family response regulator
MRVLLADDHRLLVEGLSNLLQAHGVEIAGVARDGFEAVARTRELAPDVVLMDIRMPGCDGLAATRLIKAELPQVPIVILTTSTEDDDLFEAIKSGANGYLLKSMDAEALVEALTDALAGVPPLAPGLAARLLAEFAREARESASPGAGEPGPEPLELTGQLPVAAQAPDPGPNRVGATAGASATTAATPRPEPPELLTGRQLEILQLVAEGLSYKEIGHRVFLSPRTVKYHMAEIMRKLHLESRAKVLAYAAQHSRGGA